MTCLFRQASQPGLTTCSTRTSNVTMLSELTKAARSVGSVTRFIMHAGRQAPLAHIFHESAGDCRLRLLSGTDLDGYAKHYARCSSQP